MYQEQSYLDYKILQLQRPHEEILDLNHGVSVQDLKDLQVQKYKIADPEAVQIAVNQDLNSNLDLKEGDEVAFLPPFAGG